MIYQPIAITDVIKKTKQFEKEVKKGRRFTVFSRSQPIFHVLPIKEQNNENNTTIPTFPLGLPVKINIKSIYADYLQKKQS